MPNLLDRPGAAYARLVDVMAALRHPQTGCPWDLEQSLETLKAYLIEESYETLDAIDRVGPASVALPGEEAHAHVAGTAALREELGDVLLQVVFQSRIAEERGWFDAADVAHGIADKMIHRHPHVFGPSPDAGTERLTPGEVVDRWEDLKRREGRGALAGVPRNLPALLRGQRVGDKAAATGFDWNGPSEVFEKVDEELGELREAVASGDKAAIRHELGDILFALTSLARHVDVDAENALRTTLDRFWDRFAFVESRMDADGKHGAPIEELEALWCEAKVAEARSAAARASTESAGQAPVESADRAGAAPAGDAVQLQHGTDGDRTGS